MGWGRTFLLGDIGNRLDIADCEKMVEELYRAAAQSNRNDQSQDDRLVTLERENAELKLYVATLVRLLAEKAVFTPQEFSQYVDLIDREDGATDSRYAGPIG